MSRSKKHKNKPCVYCRKSPSVTADHVFPRGMFQVHQRNGLPKVPSCVRCNNRKSKLEHYLLSVLPFGATHANAKTALSIDVARRLAKNRKLHRRLAASFQSRYVPRPSGVLEKRITFNLDPECLHAFSGFAVRGLLWHHWRKLLPEGSSWKAFTPSKRGIDFVHAMFSLETSRRVEGSFGEGTVRYKGSVSDSEDGVSVWAIQLFGGVTVATAGLNEIFSNSFVAVITGSPGFLSGLQFER